MNQINRYDENVKIAASNRKCKADDTVCSLRPWGEWRNQGSVPMWIILSVEWRLRGHHGETAKEKVKVHLMKNKFFIYLLYLSEGDIQFFLWYMHLYPWHIYLLMSPAAAAAIALFLFIFLLMYHTRTKVAAYVPTTH